MADEKTNDFAMRTSPENKGRFKRLMRRKERLERKIEREEGREAWCVYKDICSSQQCASLMLSDSSSFQGGQHFSAPHESSCRAFHCASYHTNCCYVLCCVLLLDFVRNEVWNNCCGRDNELDGGVSKHPARD